MALEREQRIVPHHAVAVVDDADQLASAGLDLDADSRSPRIQRILQQLLDHRGGPFDHLAGGNLIRHLVGKNADASHELRL